MFLRCRVVLQSRRSSLWCRVSDIHAGSCGELKPCFGSNFGCTFIYFEDPQLHSAKAMLCHNVFTTDILKHISEKTWNQMFKMYLFMEWCHSRCAGFYTFGFLFLTWLNSIWLVQEEIKAQQVRTGLCWLLFPEAHVSDSQVVSSVTLEITFAYWDITLEGDLGSDDDGVLSALEFCNLWSNISRIRKSH